MNILIDKNLICIDVDTNIEPEIKLNNKHADDLELIKTDSGYRVKLLISSFDIFENNVEINGSTVNFNKYILCDNNYYNDYYMTETFVNAGARKFTNDELFFLIKNNIHKIPYDSPYLGSMLTIASYRIIDDLENRRYLIDELIHLKRMFDDNFDENNPHSIRWLISSAATMSMLLMAVDKKMEAKEFLSTVKTHYNRANLNPLSYWNLNQAMILLSLLYIDDNDWDASGTLLLSQFVFSRNALLDIFNPRNDWLLGQLLDCTALLELGKLSLILSTRCLKNNIPSSSRISPFNGNNKPVDFSPIFIRFRGLENKIPLFKEIKEKVDARRI